MDDIASIMKLAQLPSQMKVSSAMGEMQVDLIGTIKDNMKASSEDDKIGKLVAMLPKEDQVKFAKQQLALLGIVIDSK